MAKAAKSIKRTRRIFSAKFKQEAVRRLDREVKRLAQENAFLQSAAAYFARESR